MYTSIAAGVDGFSYSIAFISMIPGQYIKFLIFPYTCIL